MSHNLGSMRVIYNQKDADPRVELESIADDEGVNDDEDVNEDVGVTFSINEKE